MGTANSNENDSCVMEKRVEVDITITGILDEFAGHVINETTRHSLRTLMPRRRKPIYIEVEIALDDDISPAKALVHQEDEDTFFMSIADSVCDDFEELAYCVAHECVHMKQYLRNEVVDLAVDRKKWKGKLYNLTEVNYADLPWEQEANLLEMPLANHIVKKWGLQSVS